jgi:hypothetical protein
LLLPALQGAFNIEYVGVAWFTKQPRPYHLCTPDVQRAWEKLYFIIIANDFGT